MKVEDYVRINENVRKICVGIGKIKNINQDTIYVNMNNNLTISFQKNEIIKTSPNIIDLIEVGDYVNGMYIDGNNGKYLETSEHDMENSSLGHIEYYRIWNKDIKTVITKEQFESMEYKVGE